MWTITATHSRRGTISNSSPTRPFIQITPWRSAAKTNRREFLRSQPERRTDCCIPTFPLLRPFVVRPTKARIFHWHYARGATSLSIGQLKQDLQKFVSPILFVDGHANKHDFTRAIKRDPLHPLEPTANWIWYKPKE